MEDDIQKKCTLIKMPNCWLLAVDGFEIPFVGNINKEYFAEKYERLGYKVIVKIAKDGKIQSMAD